MSYRKGELTPAGVDHQYPWQIMLPAKIVVERWARLLGAAPRGHALFYQDRWWNVYCFADRETAERFGSVLGGCWFDPAERGRGHNWARWTPRQKPVPIPRPPFFEDEQMCNLYSHTSNRQAIIDLTKAWKISDTVGNLEPLPGIFPDYWAPIVRNMNGERELAMARWGMPSPQFALKGKKTDPGVTNIRNTKSPHWRRWLDVEHRCVVPFTSFSEFDHTVGEDGKKIGDTWFALDENRPLAFFAGIHVPGWTSTRKVKEGEMTADFYGFLTCAPNAEVGAVHEKAMPVILTSAEEIEAWLSRSWADVSALQRPLPDGALQVVARGVKEDLAG